ncbi:MAG: hypothetical protein MGF17_01220 [Trichodesmium sp. MAG_R04]|nr:hypothetical protein [Trichodesmium sp. MAG_R04]
MFQLTLPQQKLARFIRLFKNLFRLCPFVKGEKLSINTQASSRFHTNLHFTEKLGLKPRPSRGTF